VKSDLKEYYPGERGAGARAQGRRCQPPLRPARGDSLPSSTHWRQPSPRAGEQSHRCHQRQPKLQQHPAGEAGLEQRPSLLPQRTREEGYSQGVTTPSCSPVRKAGTTETRNGWPLTLPKRPSSWAHKRGSYLQTAPGTAAAAWRLRAAHRAISLETAAQAAVTPHKTRTRCPLQNSALHKTNQLLLLQFHQMDLSGQYTWFEIIWVEIKY